MEGISKESPGDRPGLAATDREVVRPAPRGDANPLEPRSSDLLPRLLRNAWRRRVDFRLQDVGATAKELSFSNLP